MPIFSNTLLQSYGAFVWQFVIKQRKAIYCAPILLLKTTLIDLKNIQQEQYEIDFSKIDWQTEIVIDKYGDATSIIIIET